MTDTADQLSVLNAIQFIELHLNAAVVAASLVFTFSAVAPCPADPIIRFEKKQHDFGKIEEGVDASCQFVIHNDGDKPLLIKETKSSCGCTIAAMKKKSIPAHSSELLKVVMDTSMKQGSIKKELTVKSNDPKKPISTIYVTANVENPHSNIGHDIQAKIFQGRCAACHVDQGRGKIGEDLYLADCAMCHGFRARGGVAPGLLAFDYEKKEISAMLRKLIADGSPVHRSMPGFSKQHGGPLADAEIDSLISYLNWKSKLEKQQD